MNLKFTTLNKETTCQNDIPECLHPLLFFSRGFTGEDIPLVLLQTVNLPPIVNTDVEAGV